ncbi:MAG TPA: 2-hydroxychromene-2-carboxylate isomerase [Aliidongia sp.]|nr:2-hydroxychromene-2-carboxylate isomerase [Aliidongia sp.]
MVKVEFHFDFGSPNAYLSHLVIPEIEWRTGVKFEYVPVLLGGVFRLTGNRAPAEAYADIRNKLDYERLEMERFIRRHGITAYKMNPFFPVNTLMLMRGAVAARAAGILSAYVDAVFAFMWSDPRKLDDPEILRAALIEAGFDGDLLLARIQDQAVKDELLRNTQASVERGAFGSPTFFVDDEIYFGKDKLDEVEKEIARRTERAQGRLPPISG